MCDDIGSSSVCFDFRSTNVVQPSNWKYVVNGRLNDSLSLDPNLYYYPLITNLTFFRSFLNASALKRKRKSFSFYAKFMSWKLPKLKCKGMPF